MKINIGKTPYLYPIPIVLIGSTVDGKCNYAQVGDVAVMGIKPALFAISLGEKTHTIKGVIETGKFSINIPTVAMINKADYCGMYSGRDVDKHSLFINEENEFSVPFIKECPVCIACEVVKHFNIEHRHIFIGKVLATFVDENYINCENGKKEVASLEKLNPLIYSLDNKYYSIGSQIGTGYKEGRDLKI